jgi:hypothetical protein
MESNVYDNLPKFSLTLNRFQWPHPCIFASFTVKGFLV